VLGCARIALGLTWEPGMCLSWNTEALVVPPALVLRGEGASVPRRNVGSQAVT